MERLQKILAQRGVASRRKCEEIILAGRVEVNGEIINTLGTKVDPAADEIKVDGKFINQQRQVYVLFNKPKGVITSSSDPEGRKVVMDYMKTIKERIYPIGRLDYETEGILLLTNDGEFAKLMTHPSHGIPKTYHAYIKGVPHGNLLDKLRNGIQLDDGMTAPAEVEYFDVNPATNETIVEITIHEGKNRQVRRMFEAISFPVTKLRRVRYGSLTLSGVPRGKIRYLTKEEVRELNEMALQSHNIRNQE